MIETIYKKRIKHVSNIGQKPICIGEHDSLSDLANCRKFERFIEYVIEKNNALQTFH